MQSWRSPHPSRWPWIPACAGMTGFVSVCHARGPALARLRPDHDRATHISTRPVAGAAVRAGVRLARGRVRRCSRRARLARLRRRCRRHALQHGRADHAGQRRRAAPAVALPHRRQGGPAGAADAPHQVETTPILADGRLVLCSSFNEVDRARSAQRARAVALRPAGGDEPAAGQSLQLPRRRLRRRCRSGRRRDLSRHDLQRHRRCAADRARRAQRPALPALRQCGRGAHRPRRAALAGRVQISSPPVVARGVVIVGSAIGDNQRAAAPSGAVRAFDARSGRALWSFDPIERPPAGAAAAAPGAANVWAPMSIDAARGLVFLPT